MIVLRTPKGWTCPPEIDGKKCEDYWRSHQVPMGDMDQPGHVAILEQWMKSYRPEELFDANGAPESGARGARAEGHAPDERQPARQRRPAAARPAPAGVPRLRRRGAESGREGRRVDARHGHLPARRHEAQPRRAATSASFSPDESNSNRWQDVLEVTDRCYVAEIYPEDDHLAPDGRVMEVL